MEGANVVEKRKLQRWLTSPFDGAYYVCCSKLATATQVETLSRLSMHVENNTVGVACATLAIRACFRVAPDALVLVRIDLYEGDGSTALAPLRDRIRNLVELLADVSDRLHFGLPRIRVASTLEIVAHKPVVTALEEAIRVLCV